MLPTISKIIDKLMKNQLNHFIQKHLTPFLCRYQKGYGTKQTLLALIESWKNNLDNKSFVGVVSIDLCKALDTLNYELLITKLNAYGFAESSLKLLHSHHSNWWHRTKVNRQLSSCAELLKDVPQGSVLGPVFLNIYLNDLLLLLKYALTYFFFLNMFVTLMMTQHCMLLTKI